MLRQSLSDPAIFSLVCSNDEYEIVACGVVGVQEISDETEEPQTASKYHEFILLTKLLEKILLVFLGR
jgi:hypothetical protein